MPPGILKNLNKSAFGPANDPNMATEQCDHNAELGFLNTSLSKEMSADLMRWNLHDDNQNLFCDLDDEEDAESVYVDLLLNPERFTGYKGHSAQRIWKTIYEENCFK